MVVSSRLLRWDRLISGIEQRKAPRAVGRFHHPGREAALANGGGLLVAGHTQNADRSTNRSVVPKSAAQSRGWGRSAVGTSNSSHRPGSQAPRLISMRSVRAALVASVACTLPPVSRQSKRCRRCRRRAARSRFRPRARDMVEQPGDLGGGEIGIEQQSGARCDQGLVSLLSQCGAGVRGAPVLPDDCIVDGAAGRAVPDDRGLALIGDADRGDVLRPGADLGERRAYGRKGGRPDRLGIVLDQAGGRIDLGQLLPRARDRGQRSIEQDRARRGGTLVDGKEIVRQARPLTRSAGARNGPGFICPSRSPPVYT